jgi:hypothetical protein
MPLLEGEPETGYTPFDPTDVRPHLTPSPPPSSPAPGDGGRLPGANVSEGYFDPRYVEDFNGLMYLGALSKEFSFVGHTFSIRTLMAGDYLIAGQLMAPYYGTIGEPRAYATAMVAMCVMSVDGQPLPTPIQTSSDEIEWARQRFNYVKSHWFAPIIDVVYNEFLALEARAKAVLDEMGKASGWEPPGSTPGSGGNSESPSDEGSSPSDA